MASWRQLRDPLYRGDDVAGVQMPDPGADGSIVRHVLYLEGFGRATPYLSTTEDLAVAERFAQRGRVWVTRVPDWPPHSIAHISRRELLQNLRGKGKGRAQWHSAIEVMQARRYVEECAEHLADFKALPAAGLRERVDAVFKSKGA